MEPITVGEVRPLPYGTRLPKGWLECAGQILKIADYPRLFPLLGNNFGGDGRTTFGIPDLRGRTIVGLDYNSYRRIGQQGGYSTIALEVNQIPEHRHTVNVDSKTASSLLLSSNTAHLANMDFRGAKVYGYTSNTDAKQTTMLNRDTIAATGSGKGHNNMMPYMALVFCIATEGYTPFAS